MLLLNKTKHSRFATGYITIKHKGKIIPTSVGSESYEAIYTGVNPSSLIGKRAAYIPAGYEHRPDLISNLFYTNSASWWMVCEDNSIFDIFEQLNATDQIFLPQ